MTSTAHRDAPFGERASALAATDPELVEVFGDLASEQVLLESRLDTRTRRMVQLAALVACQGLGEYRALLDAALGTEVTPVEAKEIVYHAVPYVGMARVLDALHVTNDVLVQHGVELPAAAPVDDDPAGPRRQGARHPAGDRRGRRRRLALRERSGGRAAHPAAVVRELLR